MVLQGHNAGKRFKCYSHSVAFGFRFNRAPKLRPAVIDGHRRLPVAGQRPVVQSSFELVSHGHIVRWNGDRTNMKFAQQGCYFTNREVFGNGNHVGDHVVLLSHHCCLPFVGPALYAVSITVVSAQSAGSSLIQVNLQKRTIRSLTFNSGGEAKIASGGHNVSNWLSVPHPLAPNDFRFGL